MPTIELVHVRIGASAVSSYSGAPPTSGASGRRPTGSILGEGDVRVACKISASFPGADARVSGSSPSSPRDPQHAECDLKHPLPLCRYCQAHLVPLQELLQAMGELWSWTLFFAGVTAVGVGYSYYHLKPNNATLVLLFSFIIFEHIYLVINHSYMEIHIKFSRNSTIFLSYSCNSIVLAKIVLLPES